MQPLRLSFLTSLIRYVESASQNLDVDLSPTDTATFFLCIAFTVFIFLQAWGAFRLIRNHNEQTRAGDYVTLFLASTVLFVYYILAVVYLSADFNGRQLSEGFHAVLSLVKRVQDALILGTLFLLLDHRGRVWGDQIDWKPSTSKRTRILAGLFFFLLSALAITGAVLRGTLELMSDAFAAFHALSIIYHCYAAFYVIVTVFLGVLAMTLWIRLSRHKIHDPIIQRMTIWVLPLLVLRALLKLSINIVRSIRPHNPCGSINYEAVLFFDVLISGVIYLLVISSLITIGQGAKIPPGASQEPVKPVQDDTPIPSPTTNV